MAAELEIRQYVESDRAAVVALTEELQDYLKAIDPLYRLIRTDEYGEWYTTECLNKVDENHGGGCDRALFFQFDYPAHQRG